ncbi:hypothetical protein [Cupriavidus metallidurans]|uniref:hypothetical protein n=1 Tax=Cupriavidus metallidurans TaxID=119219 RepID=UPI0004938177|nr:hypothetical protein [Cupriavidus metallidurans]QGS32350.1 hypothetical protein FOB83_26300 [Cupriavidus metallidurans]
MQEFWRYTGLQIADIHDGAWRHEDLICRVRLERAIPSHNFSRTLEMDINYTVGPNRLPIGILRALDEVGAPFRQARGLPGNMPVLTCAIPKKKRHLLGSTYEKSNLGFGCIDLDEGRKLQTLRFQMGDLQFYFVADILDSTMWAAIDMWRTVGRLPFLFYVETDNSWDASFVVVDAITGPLRNEAFRGGPDAVPSASTAYELRDLVLSGQLQKAATSDIPGVPLRHVFVNIMATSSMAQALMPHVEVGRKARRYA